MFPLLLAFRNVISRKSSFVIVFFIAFAISLLVFTNSIFDGTDSGLETTFINSFTGDIVIRPASPSPLSLFGDETPVTGSLSEIPTLTPYATILDSVKGIKGIEKAIPQLTFAAALNIDDEHFTLAMFGVNADEYFDVMTDLEIIEGTTFSQGEKGIMLNTSTIDTIEHSIGRKLQIGEKIQLAMSTGSSFTIRSVPLTGVYSYAVSNSTLERIGLVDAVTLRDLIGVSDVGIDESLIQDDQKDLMILDTSIDDLFGTAEDTYTEAGDAIDLGDFKYDAQAAEETKQMNSSVWNFIICKTENGANPKKIIRKINRYLRKSGYEAQAVNWRTAAGSTVTLIYFIRIIFNVGLIIILATGFIVVNNTLIISALDRIKETGTLRAIGANRVFITLQFFAETFILSITAGIIGCILGVLFTKIVSSAGISITNTYLIQLFGGTTLSTEISLRNISNCMGLAVLLAIIGSLYPVHVALDSSPVAAMRSTS